MREEILRLTKFWYQYVSLNHHKDRDCHFYINEVWSYGELPKYRVEHHGYIADEVEEIICATHQGAEEELIKLIYKLIEDEKEWATKVLSEPDNWDNSQVQQAVMITNLKP